MRDPEKYSWADRYRDRNVYGLPPPKYDLANEIAVWVVVIAAIVALWRLFGS